MLGISHVLLVAALSAPAEAPESWRRVAREHPAASPLTRECLSVWASLAARAPAPAPAGPVEAELLREAGAGLQVFARVLSQSELRVGVVDPLEVVGRVQALILRVGGSSHRLQAQASPKEGADFAFDLPEDFAGVLVIRALARSCRPGQVITELRLSARPEAEPVLPPPPDPKLAAGRVTVPLLPEDEVAPRKRQEPFAWWWFALLGLAAAGVGAAAWQEAR